MAGSAGLVRFAALAAVLAGAAPVRGAGWGDFDARFRAESMRILKGSRFSREHYAFAVESGVTLEVVSPGTPRLSVRSVGYYDGEPPRILLNRKRLHDHALRLTARGFSQDEAAVVLAWQLAPTVVHELQHGLSARELHRLTGLDFPVNSIEEEVLASFAGAKVSMELLHIKPAYFSKELLADFIADDLPRVEALRGGPAAFTAMIRANYPGNCSILSWSRAKLLAWLEDEESRRCARLKEDSPSGGCGEGRLDAIARKDAHGELRGLDPDASTEKSIQYLRRSKAAAGSRRNFGKLREFYRDRSDAMTRELRGLRRYHSR